MTLTALRLSNFKAFGAVQRIPLRPITLVFGANSAGKSSLIHALALAHHAVETGELDTQRTQIGGEAIDLGGFRQYVHRRERGRQVELAFEIDPGRLSGRVAQLLRSARGVVVELAIGAGYASDQRTLFGCLTREIDHAGAVRVERFALEVDGTLLLSMSARSGGLLRLDRLEHQHPAFRELLHGIVTLATTTEAVREEDFAGLGEVLDALVPRIIARRRGLMPRIEDDAEPAEGEAPGGLLPVSRGRRQEDLARATRLFLPGALRDLVDGLASAVEHETRRLRYLGPLRSYPPRHLAFAQHHDPNWFAGGGYAWDVVRTREDIRRQVNGWLGDATRLKSPYELVVRDLLPAVAVSNELPPKIAKALHDLAGTMLAKLNGEEQPELVALAIEVAEQLAELDPEDAADTLPEIEALVAAATDSEELAARWAEELVEARSEA
ncbi:MAG: AAA family ATPase, partial [Myxococcota bacterium]